MAEWTFLTNHALVLIFIAQHPQSTGREISAAIGLTERAIRKIIADLVDAKYLSKEKQGRRIRYHTHPELELRHHTVRELATIGEFLEALGLEKVTEKEANS